MSAQQHCIATLPVSKQAVEESFINGEELATKILPGVRQTEDTNTSGEVSNKRKRHKESEARLSAKRSKGRPFRDSLPTPWKLGSYVDGSLKITWEERIVREEKYSISIGTSSLSINAIKDQMSGKGWDLGYITAGNSDDHVVKVPSEFGHSFQHILEDLKGILKSETEPELQSGPSDAEATVTVKIG